jgi:hypothetical protein
MPAPATRGRCYSPSTNILVEIDSLVKFFTKFHS